MDNYNNNNENNINNSSYVDNSNNNVQPLTNFNQEPSINDNQPNEEQPTNQTQTVNQETSSNEAKGNSVLLVIFNGLMIFASFYGASKFNSFILLFLPIYLIIFGIVDSLKDKKESVFPTTVFFGGMICAILLFCLSMTSDDIGFYNHYSIVCGAAGFIGFLLTNIIKRIISNRSEIKALETILIIAFFAILIGGPYYVYLKRPSLINKYILYKDNVIEAKTEREFVIQTLNNRYDSKFSCDVDLKEQSNSLSEKFNELNKKTGIGGQITEVQYGKDKNNRIFNKRVCADKDDNLFVVTSTEYNKGDVEFIVEDKYIDLIKFDVIRQELISEISKIIQDNELSINIYFYPEENCLLLGNCPNIDLYMDEYSRTITYDNRYENSVKADYSKLFKMEPKEIVNSEKILYYFDIQGQFGSANILNPEYINKILNLLNERGYKNNYGYEIDLRSNYDNKVVYSVTGTTNDSKEFKDPKEK